MKLLDYIFLHRPMLLLPVWTIALLGYRAALWPERSLNPFIIDRYPIGSFLDSDVKIMVMLLVAALVAGGAFIINQIYDIETDRKNQKLFLLAEGHIGIKEAWALYIISNVIGISVGFVLNWQLGILLAAGALLGIQYSHPRFKVRRDPYKSFRNNILAHGMLAFLFGWVLVENFNIEGVLKSVPYMLGVGALYLNTTLPDRKGDAAVGKRTYAVVWGKKKTQTIAGLLIVGALLTSVMAADYAFTVAAAISLPFFLAARIKLSTGLSTLATKVAILTLSLMAAIFFPLYIVLLLLTILLSRFYYARKFSIVYPAIREEAK